MLSEKESDVRVRPKHDCLHCDPHSENPMNNLLLERVFLLAAMVFGAIPLHSGPATAAEVTVGDAYVRSEADDTRWIIGSQGVEQVLECSNERFLLTSYKNKLTQPATEYVAQETACAPFGLEVASFAGRFSFDQVWNKSLEKQAVADPAADNVTLDVQKGQLVGFCVLAEGDAVSDHVEWVTSVAYANGPTFVSSEEPQLAQGPIWFYYQRATGSGCLEELGETCNLDTGGVSAMTRVATGYRAPPETHGVGAGHFTLKNSFTLVRAWKAPQDGKVTIRGQAKLTSGSRVRVSIVKITEVADSGRTISKTFNAWNLEHAEASQVDVGGRPAVQLSIVLSRGFLRANVRMAAYPGTPVLRQWVTLENRGGTAISLQSPAPLVLSMNGKNAASYTNYWLCGGTSRPNQGVLQQAAVGESYHHAILGERSDNLVPWTAWQRKDGPADGCFVALDYLGTWNISSDCVSNGPAMVSVSLPTMADYSLPPGQVLDLPITTTGVFHRSLDDMGAHLYDWQYQYMWDHTNPDYYALSKWAVAWFPCARNLQEQFTARLAQLDMDADLMREMGFDMLWDDAGWSRYPTWPVPDSYVSVFTPTYEGPDFGNTLHYLKKMGMKWILWFAGRPSAGLMDNKVAAWGDFQWRTDGVGRCDWVADRVFRETVSRFLEHNPRSSFHTCCGGSRYAHQFEIMRLGDVHYLSDGGRGPELNYFFSYLETPDKWVDVIETLGNQCQFNRDTSRQLLTLSPFWGMIAPSQADREMLRLTNQLYDYLKREGVAGRWSYAFHPKVTGDNPAYYFQRTNHDRTKACIILRHRSQGTVAVHPVELLPDHSYSVGFDSTTEMTMRSGADLMDRGIEINDQKPGELIYLGLSDRPGSGNDRTPPQAPSRVLARCETNIGHNGIGVHWSPGADDRWVGYYEVRRNDTILGKAAKGTYYFDHSESWDPKARYEVRTVDGDGNASSWAAASLYGQELPSAWALGGHSAAAGRDGWQAETTDDGKTFEPMKWVPPAKNPGGDLGGTPNQPGGVEGYWEGKGEARVGRGWQQAASDTACVRTWITLHSGHVRVVGRAMKEYYHQTLGTGLQTRIMLNDRVVWPANGDWAGVPLKDLYGAAHELQLEVEAGDALRFVLDRSADPANAIAVWMPRIVHDNDTPSAATGNVVRILCGAEKPYTDRNGNVWSADLYFSGGAPMTTKATIDGATPTSEDQPLYQSGREGRDFSYSIPVEPGLYAIRLKFAEPTYRWFFERPFNVSINGREVMHNMDICHVAKGLQKAHERVFRFLVPDGDGKLVLRFSGGSEPMQKSEMAMVQAIEVLPETKPSIRIDCGSKTDLVDWNSSIWAADDNHEGGVCIESKRPVLQASPTLYDQQLYQTARAGKEIRYSLTVPPGLYTVHLKFAELWLDEAGKRPMDIEINGQRARQRWDPASAAGECGMAADVRVEDVTPNAAGQIIIRVSAVGTKEAILQGIELE
jgi:hypothetical protein